jgi:hypothetical protein
MQTIGYLKLKNLSILDFITIFSILNSSVDCCSIWYHLRSFVDHSFFNSEQGDQIGRIFAYWVLTQGSFLKNTEVVQIFGPLFPHNKLRIFWQNTGWATIWPIFYKLIWSPWLRVNSVFLNVVQLFLCSCTPVNKIYPTDSLNVSHLLFYFCFIFVGILLSLTNVHTTYVCRERTLKLLHWRCNAQ